jgi:hypothetical protein
MTINSKSIRFVMIVRPRESRLFCVRCKEEESQWSDCGTVLVVPKKKKSFYVHWSKESARKEEEKIKKRIGTPLYNRR